MTAHNHCQRARRQAARHLDVARRIGAGRAVVVVPHVGGGDNHVRFFVLLQFLNHQLRFICRFAEFDIGEELRVTYFGRVVGSEANDRNF